MPKRIIDGEALWGSSKIAALPVWAKAEFANLLPLALANGVFECEERQIWARVYSFNRPEMTVDQVGQILGVLEKVGLLGRWQDKNGKNWGYWIGIHKSGRLPSPSRIDRKHEVCGPEPPQRLAKRWLTNGDVGSGSGSGLGFGSGLGSRSGSGSTAPSQDAVSVPVETVEEPSGDPPSLAKVASEKSPPKYSGDPLKEELYRGIYRKKIEAAMFDAKHLPFAEMMQDCATEAALSLCSNRSGKMVGIDRKDIAAMVVKRCTPSYPTFQAINNFDSRRTAIVNAIVNATIDAAVELYLKGAAVAR